MINLSSLSTPIAGGRTPRPDQVDVAANVLRWFDEHKSGDKGVVVEMPTGGGKSITAMIIIRAFLSSNSDAKVVFMVHRRELFKQISKEFKSVFGEGEIDITEGTTHTNKPTARIRVAMEQTIASKAAEKNGYEFPACDVLFVDEAHSMNYQSFLQPIIDRGTKVVGLSATPDDWRMLRFWQPMKILGVTQQQLEELGVLVEPTFFTPEGISQLAKMIELGGKGSPTKIKFSDVLEYIAPEMMAVEEQVGRHLRWIVKTQSKNQARTLAKHLCSHGIPTRAFWSGAGGGKKAQMDRIMDGNSPDGTRCAVVVQRFAVGFDHAGIEGIVLTGEMKYALMVQTVGRALRPGFPRVKDDAYVIDLAGNLVKYLDKYVTRREMPSPFIPERVVRKKKEGADEKKKKEKPIIDYEVVLHEVKLSHLDKTSKDMETAILFAYCAVLAEKEVGVGDDKAKERAKRTAVNYWMLTKKASGGRAKMKRAIKQSAQAKVIWWRRLPMPDALMTELKSNRRTYAMQKEIEMNNFYRRGY